MAKKSEQTSATMGEFTLKFMKKITNDFSARNIIGRGAYGVVYKGELENGGKIALKKLHNMPQIDDTQFTNEYNNLVEAQHPNITRLIGYCFDTKFKCLPHEGKYVFAEVKERVLCLEYLHGGSLDRMISDESCGWHTRFKIIVGVCEGLNYLHNGCKHPMYHLDLKPANILLDTNLVPKIGDLGLSRLFPSAQTYITGKTIGTVGYIPPEFIHTGQITSKYDVFSLGVIIIRIMTGHEAYYTCKRMSPQDFHEQVHANWGKRMQGTMSLNTSKQIETCIKIALRCVEDKRESRPTIAEIVDDLNKIYTAETSLTGQIDEANSIEQLMEMELAQWREEEDNEYENPKSGGIVFSTNYRPPVPLDIFSCAISPSSTDSELCLTDGVSYNYNGRSIPPAALKTLLKNPQLAAEGGATDADVDAGHVSGLVFVSERGDGLETLYIALRFNADSKVKVFALADIFGAANFSGTRLEDSGCIGGGYCVGSRTVDHCLIYVSTKDPVQEHNSPWTVVYQTSLSTGKTKRITPRGQFDLSPAVSPSGRTIAVASFQSKSWNGGVENLKTDIYVMHVEPGEYGRERKQIIENGGWPSWGSDNIIFFHRGTDKILPSGMVKTAWAVFRYEINTEETVQVTPEELDAVTPAAISETSVAVATIRHNSESGDVRVDAQYRQIEIFDMSVPGLPPVQITQKMRPLTDHYNPFVLDGAGHIGYHRCKSELLQQGNHAPLNLHRVQSPVKDVGMSGVSGVYPAISKDGSKLAFVDKEFKAVWVADSRGPRVVYEIGGSNSIFCLVWNQNPSKDTLYVCVGRSFSDHEPMQIYAICDVSGLHGDLSIKGLTKGRFNNAFPSSNPEGTKFVFRSTRDGGKEKHSNLYIMNDTEEGDFGDFGKGTASRLTAGPWTDTQCQWSPDGVWIVFSSTRNLPLSRYGDPELDKEPRHFSVYLVKACNPAVVIRVMDSQVSHPVFSPDGRSIAVIANLAVVSVDPISVPKYLHRDIFVVDIDLEDPWMNQDLREFRRMTHSRHDCGMLAWTPAERRVFSKLFSLFN